MSARTENFAIWRAEAAERRKLADAAANALKGGYRRERPRHPEKAALLREVGVPEHLIGPSGSPDQDGKRHADRGDVSQ